LDSNRQAGRRIRYLNAFDVDGETRFNIIFNSRDLNTWEFRRSLTASQFEYPRWSSRARCDKL
jgi:hypothetical protein